MEGVWHLLMRQHELCDLHEAAVRETEHRDLSHDLLRCGLSSEGKETRADLRTSPSRAALVTCARRAFSPRGKPLPARSRYRSGGESRWPPPSRAGPSVAATARSSARRYGGNV